MINIIVCGAAGRMGSSILRLSSLDSEIKIAGALERKNNSMVSIGEFQISDNLKTIISLCDVIIDFTSPSSSIEHLEEAVCNKKAIVIGTTGFNQDEIEKINNAAKTIPVVLSPNMSIGINLMLRLVAETAKYIPNYDVEILELHHNQKKDAPSGTAMKLAQVIADTLDRDIEKDAVYGRKGITCKRKKEDIGILAVRGGDIVGDHTVFFAGQGERIEITHRAQSRDTLALGAITAAKWLAKQKPGLYSMQDVLGL